MTNIHLLVLIHGMWGNPAHIAELDRFARETYSDAGSDGTVLHVLKAESIRDNSTYDGVDWGGERIAKEVYLCNLRARSLTDIDKYKVMDAVKDLECKGDHVIRFSVTGYSLGGLVARYLIGWELICSVCLRVLNGALVFCTTQVSSKTLHLSTLILLLHRMLGCLAIHLYSPLLHPCLGLNFFHEQASSSSVPTNGPQKDAHYSS